MALVARLFRLRRAEDNIWSASWGLVFFWLQLRVTERWMRGRERERGIDVARDRDQGGGRECDRERDTEREELRKREAENWKRKRGRWVV